MSPDRDYLTGFAVLLVLSSLTFLFLTYRSEYVNASFKTGNGSVNVTLEIADTPKERRIGLMNRTTLPDRYGMLFEFKDSENRSFWMKNTLIPLDIIFLDENMTVINIEHAAPAPNTSEENLKLYRSERPARYVVEMRQGFAENYSIQAGDRLELEK